MPTPFWRRLIGFTILPAIAAVSPLLVLPVVARTAGAAGWSSAIAGESVGGFAAIAIGYGWMSIGPALISVARDDRHRGTLYRESLVVRLIIALIALPVMGIICWLVASPGAHWLSVLMGLQGALIALSFTWFAAGVGDPKAIAIYDAVPRLLVAIAAALVIARFGFVELYPLAGIAVTLVGTGIYTWRLFRRYRAPWPRASELRAIFRIGAPAALNDVGLGAYSSVPTPIVNVTAPPITAAGFASADKMTKLGMFLPNTLANALQSWVAEVHGSARARRMQLAVISHAVFGIIGGLVLALMGGWLSALLFGPEATASEGILIFYGLAFALFSTRTSLTRHILFPAGASGVAMRATLIATVVSIPLMVVLAILVGPIGVAIAFALAEAIATGLLVRTSIAALRRFEHAEPMRS